MVNIISGMNFIVDFFQIDYENIPAAFSFRANPTTDTNIIYGDPWAINAFSGILETVGGNGFFTYSGTGYFNGNNYFQLSENYSLNDSTILISYEKLRAGNEILLSSVTGSSLNDYAGFHIGINDANKLYLKYWNNIEGPFTFTYEGILSDKNVLIINRNSSFITLGHFNNNTFEFSSQTFEIYENNFINSSILYVGGNPNSPSWDSNNPLNFSGYMDRLYIFNNTPYIYANTLVKGLFSEPTGFEGELEEYCYLTGFLSGSGFSYSGNSGVLISKFESGVVGITGYTQINSGYVYTGITGYSKQYLGFYIDNCGNNIDITTETPLSGEISREILVTVPLTGLVYVTGFNEVGQTGIVSGISNVFVTGVVCDSYFNSTGEILYNNDYDYLLSLSYRQVSLLSPVDSTDPNFLNNNIVEIYAEKYKSETLEYNKNLDYDTLNENHFYIDREFAPNEILMFGNGQALIDSGYELIPSGYEIIRNPKLDYFITGVTVETNKFFVEIDFLFYDYFSGRFWALKNTGNIVNIPDNINNNYWVFINGQKLISGINYEKNSNTLILTGVDELEENYIIFKEILDNYIYKSGLLGTFEIETGFNHECSQVYYNGIKQKIYNNYIENSHYDLISGIFKETSSLKDIIYNNTDDFFV
jgi:hypothetical protein